MTGTSPSLAFLDIFSGPEIVLILAAVLIFFGGDKMPDFARGLGKAMRELKKAATEVENEFKRAMDESERQATTRRALPPVAPNPDIVPSSHSVSIPPVVQRPGVLPPEERYDEPIE